MSEDETELFVKKVRAVKDTVIDDNNTEQEITHDKT